MKNFNKYILIATIAVLFNSCAKDGAPGTTGPQGPEGNANINETIFAVQPNSWGGTVGNYIYIVSDTNIINATTDIVEVSVSFNQTYYFALPCTNLPNNGDELFFGYQNGQITFYYGNTTGLPTQTITFKVSVTTPQ